MMFPKRLNLVVLFAVCTLFLFSGSPALAADGSVQGVVTLKGKPVAAGRIIFHLDKDQFVGAKIMKDGSYSIDRVPAGKWRLTIEGDGIDAKYSSEDKSPIMVEIKEGKQNLNVELQ